MTRCISFGKSDDNVLSGDFMTLHLQKAQLPNKSKIELIDCYGVSNGTQTAVVYGDPKNYEIYVTYDGIVNYFYTDTDETTKSLADDQENFEMRFKYLINGDKVNYNAATFTTENAVFANWVATGETVEYAEGKTIAVVMPSMTKDLIDGKLDTTPPIEEGNSTGDGSSNEEAENKTEDKKDDKKDDKTDSTTTEAPVTEAPATTEPAEAKGCGSVIGVGAATVMAVATLAVVATRKKED